jgi:glycosyltransferase involved in cell wall biosynthesis
VRIVMVIPVLRSVGGLERVATTLAVELAQRGHRVVVCWSREGEFARTLRDGGVELVRIRRPRPKPQQLLPAAWDLGRVLARERPDVVHAHNPAPGLAARLARTLARTRRTAVVTSFHGVHPEYARFSTLALRAADLVIAVGSTSGRALGLPPSRVVTIVNAIVETPMRPVAEIRRELGAEDAELVVNVARYVGLKNQALLLDAIARLAPSRPRLRAVLVGDGELQPGLKARAERLGISDRVSITGHRADAVDVIAAGDVFALTSDREGLPLTILEAMTYGRPIVATSVGSIPDTIEHERTGLIVPPRDLDALTHALERLLDDRGFAERLGAAARSSVRRRHSVEQMVERTLAAYASAAERRRASVR